MDQVEAGQLKRRLASQAQSRFDVIDVFPEIGSTNSYLLGMPPPQPGRANAALADRQTAGRGRLNNRWHSPPGSGLYLSVAYTLAKPSDRLPSLTLAAGVAILQAIEDMGVRGAMLKWPNDIVLNNGKLGGILTELQPASTDMSTVIVGTGLNIDMRGETDDIVAGIGRVADFREALPEGPDPLELAVAVLGRLIDALVVFDHEGLAPFVERWCNRDWLANRAVRVASNTGDRFGVAAGIDEEGALLLRQDSGMERIISGTVVPVEGELQ